MVHQLGGGDIAGIVAGAVAGVALLGTCGWCLWRRRRRQQRAPRVSPPPPPPPTLAQSHHVVIDLDAGAGQRGRTREFTPARRSSSAPPALLRPFDSPPPEPAAPAPTPEPAVAAVAPDSSEDEGDDFIHLVFEHGESSWRQ